MKIHLCIVSKQILANYIPLLMNPPEQVFLLSSKALMPEASRFSKMLHDSGVNNRIFGKMPDSPFSEVKDFAKGVVQDLKQTCDLTINITGGTKLMAMAVFEIIAPLAHTVIYTNTASGQLEYLKHSEQLAQEPLQSVLKAPNYLQAYGANYKLASSDDALWCASVESRQKSTRFLVENIKNLQSFIGVLNHLANAALSSDGESLEQAKQTLSSSPKGYWRTALQTLADDHILRWDGDKVIEFLAPSCARFCAGFWLEEYVFTVAKSLGADDVRSGVEITWGVKQETKNELDLVIVHNNRMLILECKTLRFGNDHQKDVSMLYKLDSLGESLRGLFGENWLVSARDLGEGKGIEERAKNMRLRLVKHTALKDLDKSIAAWMARSESKTA